MEIELPLVDCPRNLGIFGHLTRKDVDMGDIFFDAVLQDTRAMYKQCTSNLGYFRGKSGKIVPILPFFFMVLHLNITKIR